MQRTLQLVQQMREDARKKSEIATQLAPPDSNLYHVQTRDHNMVIRLRKLHIGEPRRRGDLWLDNTNRLVPLVLPWWRAIFGYGVVLEYTHADHFRIIS